MKQLMISILLAGAFLTGCAGTSFKWDDAKRIRPGMTEAQVVEILGEPYARSLRGNQTLLVWSHANSFSGDVKSVSYVLQDGRVIATPFEGSEDTKAFQ